MLLNHLVREYRKCLEFRNSENDVRKRETILLWHDVVYSYSKVIKGNFNIFFSKVSNNLLGNLD